MVPSTESMLFNKHVDLPSDDATLIEVLPGHGMVGSIALDQIIEPFASRGTRGSRTPLLVRSWFQ
jgi:predicted ATP-grasp superfamily ATP-dependent carboligase